MLCMPLCILLHFFFFTATATTEIYTLSLHDALPIFKQPNRIGMTERLRRHVVRKPGAARVLLQDQPEARSEEHTSELQSRQYLVCRLLLEKKKNTITSQETNIRKALTHVATHHMTQP